MKNIIVYIKNRNRFFIFFILKIMIMILGFIPNILIVRKLTTNEFGVFSIVLMLIGLITTFGFSWSSSSILYYGSKEKEVSGTINKTFWARNIIIFISLALVSVFFLIFSEQINNYVGLDISLFILIWLYISVAEDYLVQYYLATNKQVLSAILSITAKIFYIFIVLLFEFDIKTLVLFNIISHSTVLFYVLGIKKNDIGRFEFDKELFMDILEFSLWQLFGFSGLYLINFGDIVIIKHFMTNEDVGVYNVAYYLFNAIANFAFVVSSYYASTVTKMFSNNDKDKIRNFFYKERFLILALSTFMHLVIMTLSNKIIATLYGENYYQSAIILNILLLGSAIRYASVFYMLYYNTNNMYKRLQYLNILRAIINIVLDFILINIFGLIGPAIATTLAMAIIFVFMIVDCEKTISNKVKV